MKTTYTVLIIIAFTGAVIAALLPVKNNSLRELSPEQLNAELNLNSRFFSTDKVADLLINKDPSLMLIDVRSQTAYKNFHLPNAINIPLENLLDSNSIEMLNMDFKNKVFYSNGTADATTAFVIARRNNYENVFILEGGLNRWYETILNPPQPDEAQANRAELDLFSFRLAASKHFGSPVPVKVDVNETPEKPAKKKIQVVKKDAPSGGC